MDSGLPEHRLGPRIDRERRTVAAMIRLSCRDRHHPEVAPCSECRALMEYAWKRLGVCPHGENKPTCGKCTIHCYGPGFRERIREVMQYAGPRMLLRHPVMALRHMIDGWTGPGGSKPVRGRSA